MNESLMSCTLEFHSGPAYWVRQLSFTNLVRSHDSSIRCACWEDILDPNPIKNKEGKDLSRLDMYFTESLDQALDSTFSKYRRGGKA